MSNRRVPVSLADLKRKREEEESKASRPVFLSKKERQQAALARLEQKRAQQKADAVQARSKPQSNGNHVSARKRPRGAVVEEKLDQNELDEIRKHYMRVPTRPSTSTSRTDKTLRFDWDASDDTMAHEDVSRKKLRALVSSVPQFGRGHMGGMGDFFQKRHRTTAKLHMHDHRHWSEKRREEMTDRDWRIFREDYMISIRAWNGVPPNPARDWEETGLPKEILRLIRNVARYDRPSPIQMASIPVGLQRRDCIGLAETGSGKTAAFVLPMLVHISNLPRMTREIAARGPYALVLAPTRELALQIETEAEKFARPLGFRVVHVIGGQGLEEQASALQMGCEIVVCTPGRMVDLLEKRMAALGNCRYLILDEADRMIDMGFEPQLKEILDAMPDAAEGKRQTFMFSATMSPPVERIAKTYLQEPVVISVGETGKAADNVVQKVEYFTTESRRRDRFLQLVEKLEAPILVFANTKNICEMVCRLVEANCSVRPMIMHSGKSQEQREKTLEGFRTGRYKVLIATDVVGRGIDIKGVKNVVNFELPKTIEAYTHRIGRTGRAGEQGVAWSLAVETDVDMFGPLCNLLEHAGAQVPREIARAAGKGKGLRTITD